MSQTNTYKVWNHTSAAITGSWYNFLPDLYYELGYHVRGPYYVDATPAQMTALPSGLSWSYVSGNMPDELSDLVSGLDVPPAAATSSGSAGQLKISSAGIFCCTGSTSGWASAGWTGL